jgi:hypothetical protein
MDTFVAGWLWRPGWAVRAAHRRRGGPDKYDKNVHQNVNLNIYVRSNDPPRTTATSTQPVD